MVVHVERTGGVGVVTLDRPDRRNAVDRPTADALSAAVTELDADHTLAAVVVTGANGTFCAGADLHALDDPSRGNRITASLHGPMGPTRLGTRLPVIAAVEGHAVAGGLELALWADLRVASETAVFAVSCRRVGVPLIDGGTVRLPRIVGHGVALDMILTGREVGADEARRIGLANRVVSAGTAAEAAVGLGEQLATLPRTTMLADLASTRESFDRPTDAALIAEHERGVAALAAGGADAGVAAFRAGDGRANSPIDVPSDEPSGADT